MKALHEEDLGQAGPWLLLEELPARAGGVRFHVGRDPSGQQSVVMLPPRGPVGDDGYRLRFWAEAVNSQRLTHRCVANIADVSPSTDTHSWVAYSTFPAIPLTTAWAVNGQGFQEPEVSNLALALADALFKVHAHGLVFAGLSPETLLLTADGPRLTGFGLVRAASPEGTASSSVPGVPTLSLPPEQRSGGRPRPAGDIYALGTVLSYALTGRYPEPDESASLPSPADPLLRQILADCLSADPSERPRADALVSRLQEAGTRPYPESPAAVSTALADQAARHPVRYAAQVDATGMSDVASAAASPAGRSPDGRPVPSRRSVLLAGAVGAAGIAVGTGAVAGWRVFGEEPRKRPKKLSVAGTGPAPLWRYSPGGEDLGKHVLVGNRTLVLAGVADLTAIDLRSGKVTWSRDDKGSSVAPLDVGSGEVVVSAFNEFHLVSVKSGQIKWTETKYGTEKPVMFNRVLAASRGILYFLGEVNEAPSDDKYRAVAYRLSDRKEIWRSRIPPGFPDALSSDETTVPVVRGGELLLPNSGFESEEEWFTYLALDIRTGKRLWKRSYPGAQRGSLMLRLPTAGNQLVADVDRGLRSFDLRSGKKRWHLDTGAVAAPGPVVRGNTMYVSDSSLRVHAVDLREGKSLWRRGDSAAPYAGGGSAGKMAISSSQRTLFRSADLEIDALRTRDGDPLWRMAMVDSAAVGPGTFVDSAPGIVLVATQSTLYALPVD